MSAVDARFEGDEERAREARILERRQCVQERVAARKQQQEAQGELAQEAATERPSPAHQTTARQQAPASVQAVQQLLAAADAAVAEFRVRAAQRTGEHSTAREQEEAALDGRVAAAVEAARQEALAIDLKWEKLQLLLVPQELKGGLQHAQEQCMRSLQALDDVVAAAAEVLHQRDEQYVKVLAQQVAETDELIATLHAQHAALQAAQQHALDHVEGAYLRQRAELLAEHKAELGTLLSQRGKLEQLFMEQYLATCEECAAGLEQLRGAESREYAVLKRRLEDEVASLESHLDGMRSVYALNADKLQYNHRVLVEREHESKEALVQQKRKVTRQWEVLARVKKRHEALERRAASQNAQLADEFLRVTRAFAHLQAKYRHFKGADLAKFLRVRSMKEEELNELLEALLKAQAAVGCHAVGAAGAWGGEEETAAPGPAHEGLGTLVLEVAGTSVVLARGQPTPAATQHDGVEVVHLPRSEQTAELLIGAYRPALKPETQSPADADEMQQHSQQETGDGSSMLVGHGGWPHLEESLQCGSLSLLITAAGQLDGRHLQQVLDSIPAAPGGQQQAEGVARCLGFPHGPAAELLQLIITSRTLQPVTQEVAGQLVGTCRVLTREHLADGLARLAALLCSRATKTIRHDDSCPAALAATISFWQTKAAAVLPADLFATWAVLERQTAQQLQLLQTRTHGAQQLLVLRQENKTLKEQLRRRLTHTVSLQLPPTLML